MLLITNIESATICSKSPSALTEDQFITFIISLVIKLNDCNYLVINL